MSCGSQSGKSQRSTLASIPAWEIRLFAVSGQLSRQAPSSQTRAFIGGSPRLANRASTGSSSWRKAIVPPSVQTTASAAAWSHRQSEAVRGAR